MDQLTSRIPAADNMPLADLSRCRAETGAVVDRLLGDRLGVAAFQASI